ncbi:hypothetical protein FIA58_010015 [Flavobacterium jejuense]|uniref:Zinc ribbon domain-containing protein n=1 Tax=Flavobacterium jejuense TaxID=1544455 RepID=A0ABX0IQ95_9FLAO|nr:hypothetical protein [Flavobacterium jejuense]NHN26009.1 hypothetical protein [Flavobacterium jejuense]
MSQALAIGLILLFFLSINILLIRYILIPLFSRPILLLNDILAFLESQNCHYTSHSVSKKSNANYSKKTLLENLFSISTKYDLIAFSNNKNELTQFNVTVTNYYYPNFESKRSIFLKNRNIQFTEETNEEILSTITKLYVPKIKIVGNVCPACNTNIQPNTTQCSDCGLFFT